MSTLTNKIASKVKTKTQAMREVNFNVAKWQS
jgi:hypothetical protein